MPGVSRSSVLASALAAAVVGTAIAAVISPTNQLSFILFLLTSTLIALLAHRLKRTGDYLSNAAQVAEAQRNEIQKERGRLQELIDSIPGVVWETWGDPTSGRQRLTFVSDYVEKMLGYSVRDWLTKPGLWVELLPPQDRAEGTRIAAQRFAAGESGENEFRLVGKDGRPRWVMTRSSVIKDSQGQPIGMRGVTYDITSRKESERRLRLLADISGSGISGLDFRQLASHIAQRSTKVIGECCVVRVLDEGQLKTVAYDHQVPEAMPLLAAIADDSNVIANSPVYADLVKNPRTVVLDEVPPSVYSNARREGLDVLLQRFTPTAGLLTPMISHDRLFGTMALWRSSGPAYTDNDVQLVEAIAARAALGLENARLFETVQREAEEARRARSEAEEASRVKDEFLATLSHELRTPLNAILGWAHMLRDTNLPDERRHSAVETIVRNAQSQEQLIADILDVQRIMAGKLRLNLRSADLGDIVRAAAETVQPSADAKQIRLQLLLDLDVTPILGDADRLQQVIWNLLSNAIKFTPNGGRVQVRLLRADAHCELVVEDNGPGIAPEFLPYVFDRFRQADSSTTRSHRGLGLGLSIVRSLIEMHGGTITAGNVTEGDRTGAAFSIRLPRQVSKNLSLDGEGPHDSVLDEEADWIAEAASLEGVSVLVVEDDDDARELVATILQRCGAEVRTASSAADGMAAILRQRPDVLISDIEMPHEDGYSFIRRVRALPTEKGGRLPAAALTAYASAGDRMKVLSAGFNIHMAKPIQPAELAVVVANLSGRHVR